MTRDLHRPRHVALAHPADKQSTEALAKRRIATLDEVAKLAGVSISAASRSFTPGASASAGTRKKVIEAAEALGYRPNLVARSLSRQRTDTVAIAVTRLENAFNAELLEALSLRLREGGYGVMLFVATRESADPCVEEILRHRVGAILLCAVAMSSHLREVCASVGVPVVMVNRSTLSPLDACVVGSNREGAATVASFLLAAGHRRFGYVAGTDDSSTSVERGEAFRDALTARGLDPPLVEPGAFNQDAALAATRRLLGRASPPDALFCANDHMALAAASVATREFGRELGRDLSIVGFDDATPAKLGAGLTTFSQSVARMADLAIGTMQDLLAERTPELRRVVPGRLVVRGSSRTPASGCRSAADGEKIWSCDAEPGRLGAGRAARS